MNEREYESKNRGTCQVVVSPPTPSCFESRLRCLLDQLRALEREFFSADSCDVAGLAAAQCQLSWLRLQAGIPVKDEELAEARLTLESSLEFSP